MCGRQRWEIRNSSGGKEMERGKMEKLCASQTFPREDPGAATLVPMDAWSPRDTHRRT